MSFSCCTFVIILENSTKNKLFERVSLCHGMVLKSTQKYLNISNNESSRMFSGDEPVPLQTDGEAWLQPPGVIRIEHKNRIQMLARDRVSNPVCVCFFACLGFVVLRVSELLFYDRRLLQRLEVALKSWEVKNRHGAGRNSGELLTDNEVFMIGQLAETATAITLR